jgi:hypothetical protein
MLHQKSQGEIPHMIATHASLCYLSIVVLPRMPQHRSPLNGRFPCSQIYMMKFHLRYWRYCLWLEWGPAVVTNKQVAILRKSFLWQTFEAMACNEYKIGQDHDCESDACQHMKDSWLDFHDCSQCTRPFGLGTQTCIQYGHCSSCQNKSIMVTDRESGHGMRWSASCQRDWTMYFIGHRDDQVFRHDTSCSCCAASWFDTRELKSIVEQLRPWCPCLPRCVIDDLKYSFILCIFLLV